MMGREEAMQLLAEALVRIGEPTRNANDGDEQIGGAYWRVARVLAEYLDPRLDAQEGAEHAAFIRKTHGVIEKPNF